MILCLKVKSNFRLCPIGKRDIAILVEKLLDNVVEYALFRLLTNVVLVNSVVEIFENVILDAISKSVPYNNLFQILSLVIRRSGGVYDCDNRGFLMDVVDGFPHPL